jgi:uncharacterized protein YeaO (DUF488 family)
MSLAAADIRSRRIYDPPLSDDGARVLVDRLWPRGLRKEKAALTLWLKEIAPSPTLRKWFGHDPARWTEFTRAIAPNWRATMKRSRRLSICRSAVP